jgi:adenylylsulfate kinase
MKSKILIFGLPGSGKTTLARALAPIIGAVHFNADEARKTICADLSFSIEDRLKQANRMGWMCDQVVKSGHIAIADFVCPTFSTRAAFGSCFSIFVDRIQSSKYNDTNRIFERPVSCDVVVGKDGSADEWAHKIKSSFLVDSKQN